MRKWVKYQLDSVIADAIGKDGSFGDHAKSMEYDSPEGFASRQEYFGTHLESHSRLKQYDSHLRRSLSSTDKVLSIGSGRCANELRLIDDGHNIVCSDLGLVRREEMVKLFPELNFMEYDILAGPAGINVDVVIALSVFYVFDRDEITVALKNVAANLKPGGRFIVDWGAARDTLSTYLLDEMICKYEARTRAWFRRWGRGASCYVTEKHQGYRATDREIIGFAEEAGFRLVDLHRSDNESEVQRSAIARGLVRLGGPFKALYVFGGLMPYVRLFTFELVGHD